MVLQDEELRPFIQAKDSRKVSRKVPRAIGQEHVVVLDARTSDLCLNPWGRSTYARALIELSAERAIKDSVVVAIPFSNGSGHSLETLEVKYEWRPYRCSNCKIFDHDDKFCPSKAKKAIPGSTSGNGENMDKLMEENKVLNINIDFGSAIDNSFKYTNEVSNNAKSVNVKVNGNEKGSLLDQFLKSRKNSKCKHISNSDSNESEVEEVCMPDVIPGGGFLSELEDHLDCYDGYEAPMYDLTEQEQAICNRYDIRLNSRRRK
ncbi:zinc knuckle CX2CX4HX4C containing protein [Tanacetum coccineum]